jgi:hypothetical protein
MGRAPRSKGEQGVSRRVYGQGQGGVLSTGRGKREEDQQVEF